MNIIISPWLVFKATCRDSHLHSKLKIPVLNYVYHGFALLLPKLGYTALPDQRALIGEIFELGRIRALYESTSWFSDVK